MIIFLHLQVFSQVNVTGKITDSETGESIPFPMITDQDGRYIGLGNMNGEYSVNYDSRSKELVFTCVGYKPYSVKAEHIDKKELNASLQNDVTLLQELVITPGEMIMKTIGVETVPTNASVIRYGEWNYSAFATRFKIDKKPAKIESASVHIGNNTIGEFTLRCRLTDKKSSLPGDDILLHNEVVVSQIDHGWITFDFSDENIWVENKDVYLVIEILQDFDLDEASKIKYKINTPGFSYIPQANSKSLISTTPGVWLTGSSQIASNLKISYSEDD